LGKTKSSVSGGDFTSKILEEVKMKKFIFGFVAGALLFGTATVYAATGGNMIEVFYNIKDIKINKISSMPDEEKPFVFNGTTYVPLRYVAEAFGQKVEWEGETQTILIGESGKNDDGYYLGDKIKSLGTFRSEGFGSGMKSVYNGAVVEKVLEDGNIKNTGTDNLGKKYNNHLTLTTYGDISTTYPLNNEYKRFKAHLSLSEAYKNMNDTAKFQIILDDNPLPTQYELKAGDLPQEIDIDVSGANKITFKLNKTKHLTGDWVEIALFDARLTK
jgi:hypothetical protein